MEDKGTKISYSSCSTFKECPVKYYNSRKYRMKLEASAFAFGAAVEAGCNVLLSKGSLEEALTTFATQWHTRPANSFDEAKQVFDSDDIFYYNSDLDLRLLGEDENKQLNVLHKELFGKEVGFGQAANLAETFQDLIKQGTNLDDNQRKFYHRVLWYCCLKRGELLVKEFHNGIMPEVEEVLAIQKPIEITNDEGDRAVGFIDCILKLKGYDKPVVCDIKTAGRPYEAHNLGSSDQLKLYATAEQLTHIAYLVLLKSIKINKFCNNCGAKRENYRKTVCEVCNKGKYALEEPEAQHQIMVRQLSPHESEDVLHDFTNVLTAIKNEVRWKNPSSCMNYGTRCEYYDSCWNGKKLEELENLKERK